MKKIMILTAGFAMLATSAMAQYRMIVPQGPGGGTSVWTNNVRPHLEKFLGEKIIIQNIPGISDIPGFNKFHESLRKDNKTIMVAHGGNGESFLTDRVKYDYRLYEPISLVNLNIAVSHRTDFDPYKQTVKFGATSGRRPDVMGIILLVCGPQSQKNNLQAYINCYNKKMYYVKGMKPGEARLAALRGELNSLRETYISHKKFVQPQIDKGVYKIWFNHGILDLQSGKIVSDPNFKGVPTLEELYVQKWGKKPEGAFYDAYVLVKSFRDVLQKSLWMNKGNPNVGKVRAAVRAMMADPKARAEIYRTSGSYEWLVGPDAGKAFNIIKSSITPTSLKTLVDFTNNGLKIYSVYKPTLLK